MFELTVDVKEILGRPNFACAGIAGILRKKGIDIKTKAEDEQANVLYWMLTIYEEYGSNWKEECEKILRTTTE